MANVQGVAIVIKAFLPTGKTLDEQFEALSKVKAAHASGDYGELLKAAKIDVVLTEQKTRRIEDEPQAEPETKDDPDFAEIDGADDQGELSAEQIEAAEAGPATDDWAKPMNEEEKELAEPAPRRRRA